MDKPGTPRTITDYIDAAPAIAQPHLRCVYRILQEVAPGAQEAIKWGTPFFIEPRFLFAFAAQKQHLNFAPSPETLTAFADELSGYRTTLNYLQLPYREPMPESLVRRMAEHRLELVQQNPSTSFW